MLFRTRVLDPLLSAIPESSYGPQVPLVALVTHDGPEPPVGDGLGEVVLGLGAGLLGPGELGPGELGSGELELGPGELGSGEPGLEDDELGDGDGSAEVVLVLGDGIGERESLGVVRTRDGMPLDAGAALPKIGPQPARTTTVADTAIAGQICLVFTGKLLTCWSTNVSHGTAPSG
jgi:hypothetical protein